MINSYAVVLSGFGTYWVGSSKNQPDSIKYFETLQEAVNLAMMYFTEKHGEIDPDDEELDYEILEEYEAINNVNDIGEIGKGLEKFVIGG